MNKLKFYVVATSLLIALPVFAGKEGGNSMADDNKNVIYKMSQPCTYKYYNAATMLSSPAGDYSNDWKLILKVLDSDERTSPLSKSLIRLAEKTSICFTSQFEYKSFRINNENRVAQWVRGADKHSIDIREEWAFGTKDGFYYGTLSAKEPQEVFFVIIQELIHPWFKDTLTGHEQHWRFLRALMEDFDVDVLAEISQDSANTEIEKYISKN